MKKTTLILLALSIILFCGFQKAAKPYAIVSSGSIATENTKRIERVFTSGQQINIGIIAPDGFKYEGIRLQISKQDEKTSNWGFSIIQSRDIYIDKSEKIFKDYIKIYRPGNYIFQAFYLNKKTYPFIHKEFKVID